MAHVLTITMILSLPFVLIALAYAHASRIWAAQCAAHDALTAPVTAPVTEPCADTTDNIKIIVDGDDNDVVTRIELTIVSIAINGDGSAMLVINPAPGRETGLMVSSSSVATAIAVATEDAMDKAYWANMPMLAQQGRHYCDVLFELDQLRLMLVK